MKPLLAIKNLRIEFDSQSSAQPQIAVDNLSMDVQEGEILALVGESGSGKSVTSLSILQLLPVPPARFTSGEIIFTPGDGTSVNLLSCTDSDLKKIRGNQIAMIFQEPMTSLNPVLTCGEQVREAILAHQQINRSHAKARAIDLFRKVLLPSPELVYSKYPHELSGGQKQRVMIAMAISSDPKLLICDEPTTALDVTVQKTILLLLRSLQQELGMGVIFITHDLGLVSEFADKVIVLYKGKPVESGSISNVFAEPKNAYTQALLACRPVLYEKGQRLAVVKDFMEPVPPVVQETRSSVTKGSTATSDKTILEVRNLRVEYKSKQTFLSRSNPAFVAVDDVSFSVYEGETIGLVGESGCGKTTLGRTIVGLVKPTRGEVLFQGVDLLRRGARESKRFRKEIQIVFQDPYGSLNPKIPIGVAIEEAMVVHGIEANRNVRREKVIELLQKVNLQPEHYGRYPHEFSGGQRQRIVIARALSLSPSFVVCDESVSALDVSVQAQVLNLLNDLKQEFRFTCLFISHDLSVVRYLSDRILVMKSGRIIESGDAEVVYTNPTQEYTKLLINSIPGRHPASR